MNAVPRVDGTQGRWESGDHRRGAGRRRERRGRLGSMSAQRSDRHRRRRARRGAGGRECAQRGLRRARSRSSPARRGRPTSVRRCRRATCSEPMTPPRRSLWMPPGTRPTTSTCAQGVEATALDTGCATPCASATRSSPTTGCCSPRALAPALHGPGAALTGVYTLRTLHDSTVLRTAHRPRRPTRGRDRLRLDRTRGGGRRHDLRQHRDGHRPRCRAARLGRRTGDRRGVRRPAP